ncbi:MAG: SUF system NifU family Fe-S cluster assembly protein [Chloroflexi bacterium]|nr:SUF system NifU family Fe-S cluster assembly protein [Chloroflexota bacterium]MBI3733313.1 SUF system NifU family Fe-S cluster assembly protein [Chloroflexota bacterium]
MDDFYREIILEHYKHPDHRGQIPGASISHEEDNPLCGDRIRVDMLVKDGVVEDVKFSGQGCAISLASADMLLEEIKGKTLDEVRHLDKQAILDLIGIPLTPARLKCALLSLKVVKVGAYGIAEWQEDEDAE